MRRHLLDGEDTLMFAQCLTAPVISNLACLLKRD